MGSKMQRKQLDEIPGLLLLFHFSPAVLGIEESTFSNFWHGYGIEQVFLYLGPRVFVLRSSLNIWMVKSSRAAASGRDTWPSTQL